MNDDLLKLIVGVSIQFLCLAGIIMLNASDRNRNNGKKK